MNKGQTNRLLGYPADARLLIINADDFGMCHAVNEAVFRALKQGLLRSTMLMIPFAIELEDNHIRQTDFDFLMSQEAKDIVNEEGIILLDYRALQEVWRGK